MDNELREIVLKCRKENPCEVDIRFNEKMKDHTTFKVGGNADCWLQPQEEGFSDFCVSLLYHARLAGIKIFILGGGANIVVSDKGIRGIVLDMNAWKGEIVCSSCEDEEKIILRSGTGINDAADLAAKKGLSGLEFLAGMPGTIGGAVWMNARCYEKEVSDILISAEYIAWEHGSYIKKIIGKEDLKEFGYKKSPFQKMDVLILSASFSLKKESKEKISAEMEKNKKDREEKGHYLFPSAGSAFKNNRDFGKPVGKIIDELGLKGFRKGDAQIAPFHGNIVINTGNSSACDIRDLINETALKVKSETGFVLEPEIIFAGEWD